MVLIKLMIATSCSGLGFRPMPESANVESTLIYYKANDKGSVLKWAQIIDTYLERKYVLFYEGYQGPDPATECLGAVRLSGLTTFAGWLVEVK